MSERIPAEIWIGGEVTASLVPGLCNAIAAECVTRDWDDGTFRPAGASDLIAATTQNHQGVSLLRLCDQGASWGEFPALEPFLREHDVPYTRYSEGRDQYNPETAEFRPGLGVMSHNTNAVGEPVVTVSVLKPIAEGLSRAIALSQEPSSRSGVEHWPLIRTAYRLLCEHIPPEVPPLPPFQIATANEAEQGTSDEDQTDSGD